MGESRKSCPHCRREPGGKHTLDCLRFAPSDHARQLQQVKVAEEMIAKVGMEQLRKKLRALDRAQKEKELS